MNAPRIEAPPLPAGAWMVDLYSPSGARILSSPARDQNEAAALFDARQRRVDLEGYVAQVQHGADIVLRAAHVGGAWQLVSAEPAP